MKSANDVILPTYDAILSVSVPYYFSRINLSLPRSGPHHDACKKSICNSEPCPVTRFQRNPWRNVCSRANVHVHISTFIFLGFSFFFFLLFRFIFHETKHANFLAKLSENFQDVYTRNTNQYDYK